MIIRFSLWLLAALAAAACGMQLNFSTALLAWSALAALLCAGGAWLISSQPLGTPTLGGRLGSGFVHWGFRASHGTLAPAALISWLIWLLIGSAVISAVQFPHHALIIAAWTGDTLGLFYLCGVMLANRATGQMRSTLLKVAGVVVGMLGTSLWMWFGVGTDGARATALTIAGGPPLVVGVGYGLFLAIAVGMGRRMNWH